jgi:glycosyltransferase involved in cell wall biosynthesis
MQNTSHGDAVNRAFEYITSKYVLLVDSDVLFLEDIEKPYKLFKDGGFALMGEVVGDRGGKSLYPRVNPWFCFIDLEQLKKHGIKFYDKERTDKSKNTERVYDIGSTMFEDVVNADLMVANVKLENKYFKHYEGMSWRVQKYNPDNGDTDIDNGGTHDNKALYEYGLKVQEQYNKDVANL